MAADQDKELEEFRSLMEVPSQFEDGFNLSSLFGAILIALVMVPGALYMELIAGMGIGQAAQWVTVLLFIEVAKRANAKMSRAQIFVLFYMSGLLVGQHINGTPLFRQFVVNSESAISFGISTMIPYWAAPTNPEAYETRSFLQWAWLPAIGLILFRQLLSKLDNAVMGYGLFRITNDIEKLPFPMAPLGAQGILALAEEVEGTGDEKKSSRWRVFCIGGAMGMVFGLIYMGLPTISGAVLGQTLEIFPIPFVDWCQYTKDILPGVATGLSFNLAQLILGMVLPFYAMMGSFLGVVFTYIFNPILYHMNLLPSWEPGMETVETLFKTGIDWYFSFNIGIAFSVALVGILTIFKRGKKPEKDPLKAGKITENIHKLRGDFPTYMIFLVYTLTASSYILVSGYLIEWDPGVMIVLLFFGFLYTPIISYVTARLEGMAGQMIEIPFIREIAFILSGYKGVAIWFIPIPKANYGPQTIRYKQAELLGCKFTSIWKCDMILFPLIVFAMIGFSSYIWSLAPVPSEIYPFAQEIWPLHAKNACLVFSSTMGEYSPFREALNGWRILGGFGFGLCMYGALAAFNAPTLIFYGFLRGLGSALPHIAIPQFIGALVGKFYFRRKYGTDWRKIIPVLCAGFFVGSGLLALFFIGIVFLLKATRALPY